MRQRDLLHVNHLAAFLAFCEEHGWTVQATKGGYEVLRMTKPGEPAPLLIHRRDEVREHYTAWGIGLTMAQKFYELSRGERRRRVDAIIEARN